MNMPADVLSSTGGATPTSCQSELPSACSRSLMPSDYEAIRRDHERLYGEAVGEYGGILAELYADRTHFVFELLQNAQDAGATRIVFKLQPNRLEVRHDGRLFTESDVRSICAIKRSTKLDVDVEQIG